MNFAATFAGLATAVGAPFYNATANWPGTPTYDTGGSITSPGTPVSLSCRAQFDSATEAMRQQEGFLETDVRILVLADSLAGTLDTKAKILVASGDYAGTWALMTCVRDPASIGFECRGRKL